jgi:hypothetical protein
MRTIHILVFDRLSLVKDKASKLILHKIRNLFFHTGYYSIMLQVPAAQHTPLLKPYEGASRTARELSVDQHISFCFFTHPVHINSVFS